MQETVSVDMFTIPTLTFGILYGFVIISNARRKILYTNATYYPGGGWLGQQMIPLFNTNRLCEIKYLIRDRDSNYGGTFQSILNRMGIEEIRISPHSPWQNPYAERVIGTIKRECLNNMIILGKNHLSRVLNQYAEFYNNSRPHQGKGMNHNSPVPRTVMSKGDHAEPHLGGLQHCYKRAA